MNFRFHMILNLHNNKVLSH